MSAHPAPASQVFVARESFSCQIGRRTETAIKGKTRVSADHPLYRANPQFFEPADANFGVEQMTAAPGERRGASF